jgi:DNA-binding response OmpR family regulator
MNVIVIEDNKRLGDILRQGLVEDGHQVVISQRGDEGRDLLLASAFDVAVLDVMLPGLDGFSILEQVRAKSCSVPILMLTAKDSMPDIVHGLNLGADDYLTKPFQIQVFIARVRAVGRRAPALKSRTLTVGDLVLDTARGNVERVGAEVVLTKKEYTILEMLMRRPNQIVTRNQLREAAWPHDADVSDSSVDFYMHSLRSKIDIKGSTSLIRTVRSLGYTMATRK